MSNEQAFDERVRRVREILGQQGLDALCIRDTSNIAWVTGFQNVFDEERAHALAVTQQGPLVLHTDSRYAAACRGAATGLALEVDDALGNDSKAKTHATWMVERACREEAFAAVDTSVRMGIEDTVTVREYRQIQDAVGKVACTIELIETDGLVLALRAVKDAYELRMLHAAQDVADAAFAHIVGFMRPGATEKQVQLELEAFMLSYGAAGLAFPSIVATGAHGANPHAQPGDTPLEAGQCVVMDFGARVGGYCSDTTRMVFVGEPDARMRDAYSVLRQANEQVQQMLMPGVTGKQAHELAERILADGGYGGMMGHGLGHGVGLDVHEEPVLALRNEQPLQAGNVVTVEPGIYLEGEFGMRLEDCGVIAEDGYHAFSSISHEMVVV